MAGAGYGALPSVPSVRLWRTAFLTLRDETLTNPPGSSVSQMLRNVIFSHSSTLLSAVPELPSHEVMSDIVFMLELVATTSEQEDTFHVMAVMAQTSRLIYDISRQAPLEINLSSWTRLLNCFEKLAQLFLGKATSSGELTEIPSAARVRPAIECLQAISCITTSSHRRWSQSEDVLLVKFLLNVIVSSHAVSYRISSLTCNERSATKTAMRLSIDSCSWELLAVALSMLGDTISRSRSSFPVDVWGSMIEVIRKIIDGLASKPPIVNDNIMSRFYESFLHLLHLILTDPKCSVSDHVSAFVAVLRVFLTYGISGRMALTSLLTGCEEKGLGTMNPESACKQENKSDYSAYRPPHLRKKALLDAKHSRPWDSCYISDKDSSTSNITSSDSDFSDGDVLVKDCDSAQNSRVRVAAIICIQDLCQADSRSFSSQWSVLLPTSDVLQPRRCDATLMTCLLFDPCLKARLASASTLAVMLDGPSSIFLQVAEYKESIKCGSFTALSSSLGQILLQLHRGILYLIQHEDHGRLLALLFKILKLIISSTPYSRMPSDLLPTVIASLRRRVEGGFQFKSDQTGLLAAAVGCLTSALSTSPPPAPVRKMLFEDSSAGFTEAKKTGVLFTLFKYSAQWSCPVICLEALQALRAVSHNYPNTMIACWEQVSATVYGFLTVVCPEDPLKQSSEHIGSPTALIGEKVLTAAVKVLDGSLRAISGFQGTEDLSDDKLVDMPFASDCIRIKKISSAPSYEHGRKDEDIINSKTCQSGFQEWFEAVEKHMPLILWHSSAMVRAASVTCFAGMTSAVFISFTKEKQDFIVSSLINAAIHDEVPSVRSAACRAIGIISCFPQVCQSAQILDRIIHAVDINTRDPLVSVRITASWALANICDAVCHCIDNLPFSHIGSIGNLLLIGSLTECALCLTRDGDKVKSNAVRALGYISRIMKCTTASRFQDMPVDYLDHRTEAITSCGDPKICQAFKSYSCQLNSQEEYQMLERIIHAFISCVTTGNVKVQWNVCHALSNLFLNNTLRLQDMDWAPFVFGILLQLLRDSSNFKIRIQAAAALAVPKSLLDYGSSFSDIVQGVQHVMENLGADHILAPSNFKYRMALQKQLTVTMLHILSFSLTTSQAPLKDFLVKKSSFLEDWFKALFSPTEETSQLDAQNKSIEGQKKVMISRAVQSLIEVYQDKQHHAIAQKFEGLKMKAELKI